VDFLWKTHEYINNYIRFADAKAAVVVALASGLLGQLFTVKAHHAILHPGTSLFNPTNPEFWLGLGSLLAFSFLGLAVLFSVWGLAPHLWLRFLQKWNAQPLSSSPGLVFWGDILAHGNAEAYWRNLSAQAPPDVAKQLAHHLYVLSGIAHDKFRYVDRSIRFGFLGGVVACLVILGSG
jgi:hypothetical protein